jgi:hypothetical protein
VDHPSSDVHEPAGIAVLWSGGAPAPHVRGRGPAVAEPEAERSIAPRAGRRPTASFLVIGDGAGTPSATTDPSGLSPEAGEQMSVHGDAESLAPHDSPLLTSQSRALTGHALRPDGVLSVA